MSQPPGVDINTIFTAFGGSAIISGTFTGVLGFIFNRKLKSIDSKNNAALEILKSRLAIEESEPSLYIMYLETIVSLPMLYHPLIMIPTNRVNRIKKIILKKILSTSHTFGTNG